MGGILFTLRVCFMGKLKRIIGNDFVCVSNDVGAGAWSKCKQSQLIYYNWENELNLIKKWLSSTRNIYCISKSIIYNMVIIFTPSWCISFSYN